MPGQRSVPFLDQLRASQLLEPSQLHEIGSYPEAQEADPRKLARRLLDRGLLTRYQINQVAQGRGADLVIGSYIVLDPIGEGGMGQVYKARHQHMNRVVALKVIRKERLSNPEAVRRFYKEVQAAAQLAHPNIVLAFDAGQTGQTHYFAMEYIDGIDLSRLVKESGPLPVLRACDYIRQAALGLQHAHERGLVHRDIKPHNLLVVIGGATSASRSGSNGKDVVKVLDMGLARLQGLGDNETAVTKDGVVIGTPDFLAPEQATNARAADIRSDLYSLGCTFYYLLTGQPPFQGASLTEVLIQHQLNQARPVQELRPDVPPAVGAIVARLMAKNPAERFQTPAELAAMLTPFCQESGCSTAAAAAVVSEPNAAPSGFGWDMLGGEQAPQTPVPAFAGSQTEPVGDADGDLVAGPRRKRQGERQSTNKRRLLIGVGTAFHLLALAALIVWYVWPKKPKDVESDPRTPVVMATKPNPPKPESKPQPPDGPKPRPAEPGVLALATAIAGPPRLLAGAQEKPAQCVLFTPDGSNVLIGDGSGTIRLISAAGGQEIRRFGGPDLKRILDLAISADGRRFLSASMDHTLRLWETETGSPLQPVINNPDGFAVAMALSPDGRNAIASGIGTVVRTWDTASGTEISERRLPHLGKARALAFSADGRQVVSGDSQGKVWLWDAATAKELAHFTGHTGAVKQVALPRSGLVVSFSEQDHTLRGWNVANSTARWQVAAEGSRVAFAPDGLSALGIGKDQTLKVWDLQTGREVRSFPVDRSKVQRLWVVAPDGRSFLSGSSDALWHWTLRQPSAPSQGDPQTFPVAPKGFHQVAFSPDGRRLLAWGMDNRFGSWDIATRQMQRRFQGPMDATHAVFLADGRMALSAGGTRVSFWDVETGAEVRRFDERPGPAEGLIVGLAVSRNGRWALTAGADKLIDLWDVLTGKIVRRFDFRGEVVRCVTFSPDSQRAFAGGADSTIRGWNVTTGSELKGPPIRKGGVYCLAFAPDGRQMASAHGEIPLPQGAQVHLWDTSNWREIRTLEDSGIIRSMAFSPDGRLIVSGGDDKVVAVRGTSGGRPWLSFREHQAGVTSVAFSPDGAQVVSGSYDGTMKLRRLPDTIVGPPRKPDPEPMPPVVRIPAPSSARQEEAAKLIKDLFKDAYAKKANADRVALAEKLIDTAAKTKDKPIERFVLLREARDLAAQAGDLKLALKVIGELAEGFVVDGFDMKSTVLAKVAETATTVAAARPVLEQYFALADESQARDDYDGAVRLLSLADAVARKANNTVLVSQVEARTKTARELKEGFDGVKVQAETLKTKPKDPEASLALGQFYCLVKGDWQKGLPLLAACNDAATKAAAEKELAGPDQPASQVETGNAWWELAVKAEASRKLPLQRRAYYWYDISVTGLTGLTRTQTESRIKELEATPGFKPVEAVGLVRVLEGHTAAVRCVALSRDGRQAVSCGADGGLRLWSLRTGKEIRRCEGQGDSVGLALAPDGHKAAVGTAGGTVILWDLNTRQSRQLTFSEGSNPVEAIAFLPTGRQLVYSSSPRTLLVQNLEQDGLPPSSHFDFAWGTIKCLAVSPNGRVVVIGTQEGTVHARDLDLQQSGRFLGNHVRQVLGMSFSPDGRFVLSAGADGNVALWDAKHNVVRNYKHSARVTSVAFSPDGSRFVTGNADKTVRLWEVKMGRELMFFEGHQGEVTSVAFAPDGLHVLSGSTDKTLRWWRLPR
jgi:WD40 repeat protein